MKDRRNPYKNENFMESLYHALAGIKHVLENERNARIQLVMGLLALILGLFLGLSKFEWLWIILVIFLVIVFEYLNTVIETIVNMVVGQRFNIYAKYAKDVAAAMVVLVSTFAVIVGLFIFGPKLWNLIF